MHPQTGSQCDECRNQGREVRNKKLIYMNESLYSNKKYGRVVPARAMASAQLAPLGPAIKPDQNASTNLKQRACDACENTCGDVKLKPEAAASGTAIESQDENVDSS